MTINPNWSRWIWASITKQFDDGKGDNVLFFEGDDRDTDKIPAYIEVRQDGPRYNELSKDYFQLNVFINLLYTCHMNKDDAHAFQRVKGIAESMLDRCITVYRLGSGPFDDQSVLGTLSLQYGRPIDIVKSANFGQIDETIRLQQGTVEGRYRMHLRGTN